MLDNVSFKIKKSYKYFLCKTKNNNYKYSETE